MFNILRINNKFKNKAQITLAINHNLRLYLTKLAEERIDLDKSHLNKIVYNSLGFDSSRGGIDFQEKLFDYYESLGIKFKKDNVLMLDFIISASPEFFKNSPPEIIEDWEKIQLEFVKEQFGNNLKLVIEHNDETTKHFHIFVTPEIHSTKKYRNQKREYFKESWSLNANQFGGKKFLIQLHDAHAKKNEKFGLKRGVRGSTVKHVSVKEYHRRIATGLKPTYEEEIKDEVKKFLEEKSYRDSLTGKTYIETEEVEKVIVPLLNEVKMTYEALKYYIEDVKKEKDKNATTSEELKKRRQKIKKMQEEMDEILKEKNKQIYEQIYELKKENETLKKENEELKIMNATQASEIANLKTILELIKAVRSSLKND